MNLNILDQNSKFEKFEIKNKKYGLMDLFCF
jgi:hypothetical protein